MRKEKNPISRQITFAKRNLTIIIDIFALVCDTVLRIRVGPDPVNLLSLLSLYIEAPYALVQLVGL